jgi:CheY-like chemotaxis protein
MSALQQRLPHVLVTDIEMPHEDGYTFIRRIRSLPPEAGGRLPAAALTAYASASDRMRVLAAGFNMHVAKPVQPAELATVIANLARS